MFTVMRADRAGSEAREQIARVFAEGFTQWLVFFSKDKNRIAKAFAHMFVLDQFYVAVSDGKVAAMASFTQSEALPVRLDAKELRKHLGLFKGSLAAIFLKKEFERPPELPPSEACSIGLVGTAPEYRGQGAASQILRHLLDHFPHKVYVIDEVADTNIPAMRLYEKLGFTEYKRSAIPPKRAAQIGINYMVSLKYEK
ncbi:GNAT family N-acetyltransferase [Paenibacillus arenilitoris]|uniref:GNAT family N-acetyltransferase n=1 Tax=Paenibacillus arenilitoris TaxID=2772299 RepID=A0A927H3F8_9BACL|nr:GNAT family N-acetyltransferase [Paenibacillus arenilitoris]MBD2867286.1 GNAT family N-acetyltransferase [Paenibacillus arenilitoris]